MATSKKRKSVGYQITQAHDARLAEVADRLAAVLGLESVSLSDAVMFGIDLTAVWLTIQEGRTGERAEQLARDVASLPTPEVESPRPGASPGRPRKKRGG